MYKTKKIADRRGGFTLVEMLVVIAIILALAALAAAFAPRVNDNYHMTRAVDNLEQWLLTAKMRAKRDGLATGIRFIPDPNPLNAGVYFQCQYIQQPPPLSGGQYVGGPPAPLPPGAFIYTNPNNGAVGYYTGGLLTSASAGTVSFQGVDFTLGMYPGSTLWNQWLVQPGDYLEINGGGAYLIGGYSATSPQTTLLLGVPTPYPPLLPPVLPITATPTPNYDSTLTINTSLVNATPTTNYRILRQPRILIGEEPLVLPNNYAVVATAIPPTIIPGNGLPGNPTLLWSNVAAGTSGYLEILFSPTGAVIGPNAGSGTVFITVYDTTMDTTDINSFINRIGIVAVQTRSGFVGAYGLPAGAGLPGYNPFFLAQFGRDSGL